MKKKCFAPSNPESRFLRWRKRSLCPPISIHIVVVWQRTAGSHLIFEAGIGKYWKLIYSQKMTKTINPFVSVLSDLWHFVSTADGGHAAAPRVFGEPRAHQEGHPAASQLQLPGLQRQPAARLCQGLSLPDCSHGCFSSHSLRVHTVLWFRSFPAVGFSVPRSLSAS